MSYCKDCNINGKNIDQLSIQELWKLNTCRSIQWHNNFIGQYQQHNFALYTIVEDIMQNNNQIKSIIELGTGYGALTMILGLWGLRKNIPVVTIDIRPEKIESIRNILDILKVKIMTVDQFKEETTQKILKIIDNKPTFFIGDGAIKDWEINTYTPLVPVNSIIAGHDWMTELHPQGIKEITEKYCEPYKQDKWDYMNCQFAVWKKIKGG